jgi:N-acetyl-anhydromuramyl-L-alanine amidase AmpD
MDKVDAIIIHCSATPEGKDFRAKDIDRMHRQRGFSQIGYHYVVDLDGTVETGRPEYMKGAHCINKDDKGVSYNNHSIGICYIGGVDKDGKAKDTRTEAQKRSLRVLIEKICRKYNIVEVLGHRDTSPDKDGDGVVEPEEWTKQCPSFDVRKEYASWLDPILIRP